MSGLDFRKALGHVIRQTGALLRASLSPEEDEPGQDET